MSGKILLAYASKTKATAQHAGAIAGSLKGAGRDVEIADLRRDGKPNLDAYDAVIIGSGVRFGRWFGPAKRLLKNKGLAGKKIALFIACGMIAEDSKKQDEAVTAYIDKIADKCGVRAVSKRAFIGFMPDGKDFKLGNAGSRPVDTAESERWGRELAALL